MAWSLLLLAQGPDQIAGNAGWAGAGLLGAVLLWLCLKHLPDKDRQINGFIEGKDTQIKELIESKDTQLEGLRVGLEARIDTQRREFVDALNTVTKTYREESIAQRSAFVAESAAQRAECVENYRVLADTINTSFNTLGRQMELRAEREAEHSKRQEQWIAVMKADIERKKAEVEASSRGGKPA